MSAKHKERERWLRRYTGHFGEPTKLDDYRSGAITFRELYDSAMHTAEMMLSEAQYVQACAFGDEPMRHNPAASQGAGSGGEG